MKEMTNLISSHFSGWVCQHRNRTGGRPSAIYSTADDFNLEQTDKWLN